MKLRNKKTGEFGYIDLYVYKDNGEIYIYNSLELLFDEWLVENNKNCEEL